MSHAHNYYPECPEAFVVGLAQNGDRLAFEDLVNRRQSSIRYLMRSCCHNKVLADDLAQQVFVQVWLKLHTLKDARAFGAWVRAVAISVWLAHGKKKKDPLRNSESLRDDEPLSGAALEEDPSVEMDLDAALKTLNEVVRNCIVLNYQAGLTHDEIAGLLEIPLGTVKSHIQRGTQKLRNILSAYADGDLRP